MVEVGWDDARPKFDSLGLGADQRDCCERIPAEDLTKPDAVETVSFGFLDVFDQLIDVASVAEEINADSVPSSKSQMFVEQQMIP